jgi:DNA-directed RNA polymerase subunit RPC12/RpoP
METREITCGNCKEGILRVVEIPGTTIMKRGFTGKKSNQYSPGRTQYIPEDCPKCGSHHGDKQRGSHEDRLKRMKAIGATKIVTTYREPVCA